MTEALFRIPSRTVTYGYVEVSVDLGHSDPEIIAATYVSWVHAFQKEELATIERLSDQAKPVATASQPAGVAKDAPSGALKAPLAASQPEVDHPVDPVDRAAQMLAEGLGGVTDLGEDEETDAPSWEAKARAAEAEMGGKAPWKQEVAAPKKPWETDVTSPAMLDAVW